MKIKLGTVAWHALGLDQSASRLELVRAAFYLGYSLHRIRGFVSLKPTDPEVINIIATAKALGMTDRDEVVFDDNMFP